MSWITRRHPDWVECTFCGRKMYKQDYFAHAKAKNHTRGVPRNTTEDKVFNFNANINIPVIIIIGIVYVVGWGLHWW